MMEKVRKVRLMVLLGLFLGVIGVFSDARTAFAQEKKITAGEVVNQATLKAFVLRGKDYIESLRSVTEVAKLRRTFRTEGQWKSGSMFLVVLIYNGHTLNHGGDREADHKSMMDIEDDNGKKVVRELLAAAKQGGGFVEYHDEGVAKVAYATEFTAVLAGSPLVFGRRLVPGRIPCRRQIPPPRPSPGDSQRGGGSKNPQGLRARGGQGVSELHVEHRPW